MFYLKVCDKAKGWKKSIISYFFYMQSATIDADKCHFPANLFSYIVAEEANAVRARNMGISHKRKLFSQ